MIAFFLLGHGAVRLFELWPRAGGSDVVDVPARSLADEAPTWEGTLAWDAERGVRARLARWHEDLRHEAFRSGALQERYGLAAGEAWRLVLEIEGECGLALETLEVQAGDALLVPLAPARPVEGAEVDPFLVLFRRGLALEPEVSRPFLLWGKRPELGPLTLVIEAEGRRAEGRLDVFLDGEENERWFASTGVARASTLAGGLDEPGTDGASGDGDEVARLRAELVAERDRRARRELQWFEYNRALAGLGLPGHEGFPLDPALAPSAAAPVDEAAASAPDPEVERRHERALAIGRALSALMKIEGLRGLDLLDPGTLVEGGIGPVVFRTLDERGMLAGSLSAERLRLEGSRAARTVTIVLERGSEGHGGERVPFAAGERRILLAETDPEPWFESCPELFTAQELDPPEDDGLWNLSSVRSELNRLLGLDTGAGWFRLRSLGGVQGDELVDVQIEELEQSGRLRRRYFADRLRIAADDSGVVLELANGAIVRGGEKQGFKDGMHRIFLPRARLEDWQAARLPGLARASAPAGETESALAVPPRGGASQD